MWTEEEMSKVVETFDKYDQKQILKKKFINTYLVRKMSKQSFYQILKTMILEIVAIIGINIGMFFVMPNAFIAILSMFCLTGSFIFAEKDLINYLKIEAYSYERNSKRCYALAIQYREKEKALEKEKTYILDTDAVIKDPKEERERKRQDLYHLKRQMENAKTESFQKRNHKSIYL